LQASSSGLSKKRLADGQAGETSAKKVRVECAHLVVLTYVFIDSAYSVHPFFTKSDEPSKPTAFKWIKPNLGPNRTLLHGINLNPTSSTKVAAFDLDDTLILGTFWSKATEGEWKWLNPNIPSKLKALHDDGYVTRYSFSHRIINCYAKIFRCYPIKSGAETSRIESLGGQKDTQHSCCCMQLQLILIVFLHDCSSYTMCHFVSSGRKRKTSFENPCLVCGMN